MSETKMLQLILDKVTRLENKVDTGFGEVKLELEKVDKRIDRVGMELAELQDDAPTMREYKSLEKRVSRLEKSSLTS